MAEQRYSVCVAAERRYVLLDPVKRGHEVQDGVVAGSAAVLSTQETCASQIFTDDEREFNSHDFDDLYLFTIQR